MSTSSPLNNFFGIRMDLKSAKESNYENNKNDFWDPVENLNINKIKTNVIEILAKHEYLKANPKHAATQKRNWIIVGVMTAVLVFFVTGKLKLSFIFGLITGGLPVIGLTLYYYNLGRDLLKTEIAHNNGWLYDPTLSNKKGNLLQKKYPKLFKNTMIDDQFWGQENVRNKQYSFYSGICIRSKTLTEQRKANKKIIAVSPLGASLLNGGMQKKLDQIKEESSGEYFVFIKLEKELKTEFLLHPQKNNLLNDLLNKSKEFELESTDFNKLFAFSYDGKKDHNALEIVKNLSPAVQLKLARFAAEKQLKEILFSKSNIIFTFKNSLASTLKTDFMKSSELKTADAEILENEIISVIDIGTSIVKHLN